MIGRVGTTFGAHGVNIDAAAVGYEPDEETGESTGEARDGRHDRTTPFRTS